MSRSHKRSLLIGLLALITAIYIIGTHPRIKHFNGETMGTTYSVSYVAPLFYFPVDDVAAKTKAALESVNQDMSTYIDDSELMRFNRSPIGQPFHASKALVELISQSLAVSRLSDGAYDVTVGPLVNLWGFGPREDTKETQKAGKPEQPHSESKEPLFIEWMLKNYPAKIPSKSDVAAARARVGYQYLQADTRNDTLTRTKNIFVDLSSIAKGYGVDVAAKDLIQQGIDNFIVEVGGEVWTNGHKPDGSLWRLGIRNPSINDSQPTQIILLTNKGMATSGDYLNFFEVNGQKYSHTINPRLGRPEAGRLAEVSVLADTVARADALATMFMVLGDKAGLALANKENIAAYFTYHTKEGFKSVASKAFEPYLR